MTAEGQQRVRTLTYRAVIIGIAAMILMAMWVHFHEVLVPHPNILAENSPPASAVGLVLGILAIGGLIAALRPRLRLGPGELIVIYTMLVTSAPLMSQGMWHRFLGFVVAIPHHKHNAPLVDSFSEHLWPHGRHLVRDRRFDSGLGPDHSAHPSDRVRVGHSTASPVGPTSYVELDNSGDMGGLHESELRIRLDHRQANRRQLIHGERYYVSALFRTAGFQHSSLLVVELVSDGGTVVRIMTLNRDTVEAFSSPGGFTRRFEPYVSMPRDFDDSVDLVFRLEGPGRAAISDVVFFSNEALARLHKGTQEVRASDLASIPENSRDSLLVRPDSLASPSGIWYVLKGYVPYLQWVTPLLFWASIVAAIFLTLLGIGVIFRRQWVDNERFDFPMIMLPRLLFEQRDEDGRLVLPLFRKRSFQVGVILALLFCAMQGLAFHVPGLPDPKFRVDLAEYFGSPSMRAFIHGMAGGSYHFSLLALPIAFFVNLDLLLSVVIFFWLAKIPYYFGETFGWKNIRGPMGSFPFAHEQHIGAFLGLALIAIWVARRHLAAVGRTVLKLPGALDDSQEAMSYRAATLLVIGGFLFFAVWGRLSEVGAGSSILFFGFLVICGFSASRIRTEFGAPGTYFTPYFPFLIFFLLGGVQVFGTGTLVLAYCAGGFMAVAQFLLFAPTQVEMLHLGDKYNARSRGIVWGLILGLLGGVLIGGYVMLVWAYGVGGDNIMYMKEWAIHQDWYLWSLRSAVAEVDSVVAAAGAEASVQYPTGPLIAVGAGTVITMFLTFLRIRFVGFWLHPLGYVLANTYFAHGLWGTLLTAWIVKWAGLRIGGPRLIRRYLTPLFAGVFCGAVVGMALWDVVAVIGMAAGRQNIFTCVP